MIKRKEEIITSREVSRILGLSEQDVIVLAEKGVLPHMKVEGGFLRFRRQDIIKARKVLRTRDNHAEHMAFRKEVVEDFLYFNNFYIISGLIIIILLLITFKDFHF